MSRPEIGRLGLLVRQAAWQGRSGRDQLDLAIAAISMNVAVELFFVGDGVLQLLAGKVTDGTGLPPAASGWSSLPELGDVRVVVDERRHRELSGTGHAFLVPVDPVSPSTMRRRQAACDRLLVT